MKSRSASFRQFVDQVDDILSKIHSRTVDNEPLQPLHDDWINARERLMGIKIGNPREPFYPINWQVADHLILSELAVRLPGCIEHADQLKAKLEGTN